MTGLTGWVRFLVIGVLVFVSAISVFTFVFLRKSYLVEASRKGVLDDTCGFSRKSVVVRGSSMEPLFYAGDTVRVEMGSYKCSVPNRGEIVLVHFLGNEAPLLKRIRGVPGDTFAVKLLKNGEGALLVNSNRLANSSGVFYHVPSARAKLWRLYQEQLHGVIPIDSFLVLGETETGSLDSSRFGFVAKGDILGKAEGRVSN